MGRGALHFCVCVLAWAACGQVYAHNGPPVAYAVLSQDAEGPRAVSLSAGVALRRSAQRFQFICPGAWLDQFPAPVAALADGTVIVGATRGLMLLDDAGALRPHPDAAAVGRSSDLVRSGLGVFALRPTLEGTELIAIDAQSVRVLWRDTSTWSSLAASGDKVVLARANNRLVELVMVAAADGTTLERQSATLDAPADNGFARASASAGYALVVFRNGTMALGSLAMNTFDKLADGELSIAGPLEIENTTLLALDGKLVQLSSGMATQLPDEHSVDCLAESNGLSYACEREGISRLDGQTVADPLFRFSWLMAPMLEQVPEGEPRMLCNMQWQDFLSDMRLAMLEPLDPSVQPSAAGAAAAGAGAPAASGAAAPAPQQIQQSSGSCSALPRARALKADAYLLGSALAMAMLRCRCHRRRELN